MHYLVLLMLVQQVAGTDAANTRELFVDPHFERGLILGPADHADLGKTPGVLRIDDSSGAARPAWRLAQWASRYLLEPGPCEAVGKDTWQAETPGKRFQLERAPDGLTRLLLEVRGGAEYGGRLRVAGEPWPHLLIEQAYKDPIRPRNVQGLCLSMEMRVPFCRVSQAPSNPDPGLHTAQVSAFWTVYDLNPASPDYRDMIWFGIPLFDARYEIPPAHFAIDNGKADATGKFICLLDGKRFWSGNTGDGEWRKLDVDLVPLLREALAITQEHGYLKSTQFEDLAITSFNLGWEVTGPYDAALELRGLSMKAGVE